MGPDDGPWGDDLLIHVFLTKGAEGTVCVRGREGVNEQRDNKSKQKEGSPYETFLAVFLRVKFKQKASLGVVHHSEMESPLSQDPGILDRLLVLAIVTKGGEGEPASEGTLPLVKIHARVGLSDQGVEEAMEEPDQIAILG